MDKKSLKKLPLLLTPLVLAVNPVTVDASKAIEYDHETQVVSAEEGVDGYQTMTSTTFNGTQTYGYDGKPSDNDNDSDADPY